LTSPTQQPKPHLPLSDSGADTSVFRESDSKFLATASRNTRQQLSVILPNGNTIKATGSGTYHPSIDLKPIEVSIFDDRDLHRSLLSTADYTNQGCVVIYTATDLKVIKDDKLILQSFKNLDEKLWTVPTPPTTTINNLIHHQIDAEYVMWTSSTFGNCSDWTLNEAVKRGYLTNYPRLTSKMICTNMPNSLATAQAHHRLRIQNRSKKTDFTNTPTEEGIIASITCSNDFNLTNHSDATGRLPMQSSKGNNYILVSVFQNYIYGVGMPTRTNESYLSAFSATIEHFKSLGVPPTFQRMDNETSTLVEEFFKSEDIKMEYLKTCIN